MREKSNKTTTPKSITVPPIKTRDVALCCKSNCVGNPKVVVKR